MIEVLPIRSLTDQDNQIFGPLAVSLGKLARSGIPVASGVVVTPPEFKLKTVLEKFDFGHKEVFEQSLNLVKKEINSIPIPDILQKETKGHKHFYINGIVLESQKKLWQQLLAAWLEQIKNRLWQSGFYPGISQNLSPQIVLFVKKVEAEGRAFFDSLQDDTVINIKDGKLHPNDLKKLDELVRVANKKLFMPYEYEWIYDHSLKLASLKPYTPEPVIAYESISYDAPTVVSRAKSTVKVFLDLSSGFTVEQEADGIYIASEKIFDLNKVRDSFEDLIFRVVESALTFPTSPILFKLADKSEGMGKVRGTLRLLHQKSLFGPLLDTLDFVRYKKGLTNVHIVVPFVRVVSEFLQIKRELAIKKLSRKNSLKQWLEIAVPENIINLEDYLVVGLDGVVLNLDELIAYLNGFDKSEQELMFYKNEVKGLMSFLEDGLKLLHKSKIPFIAYGSLNLYPQVLEFLVDRGVYGVVVERYEASSAHDLLHQAEKRMILRKTHQ